jgi:hypothetical protein
MENCTKIVKTLRPHDVLTGKKPRLRSADVLQAAITVLNKDQKLVHQIELVLAHLPKLQQGIEQLSAGDRKLAILMSNQLSKAKDVEEIERLLAQLAKEHGGHSAGVDSGLKLAKQLVAEGKTRIYDPGNGYYQVLSGGDIAVAKDSSTGLASADAGGAVAGGMGGFQVGGAAGIAPGAAAGAITASTVQAVKNVVEAVLEDDVPLFEDIKDKFPVPA